MVGAVSTSLLPATGFAAPAIIRRRKSYVFVYGSWQGGWAWGRVAEILRAEGHRVITPTMTGCGERFHLIQPETSLSTHIDDVVHAVEWEEMEDIVLVGHSFAGTTITGAADRMPGRVAHIVFFDALVPTAERPAAIMRDPDTGEFPESWQRKLKDFRDGYKMVFWDHYPVEMLVPKEDHENVTLLRRRMTWHPASQWTETLKLRNGGWEPLPRTFIEAAGQIFAPSSEAMIGPARGPDWNFVSLDLARNGFLTHPKLLASCLNSIR